MKPVFNLLLSAAVLCATLGVSYAQDTQSPKVLVRFDTIDNDNDDLITADELTKWRMQKFSTRDLDADGIITRDELLLDATDGARSLSWDESTEFILAFDRDGDLEISYQEVLNAMQGSDFFGVIDYDGSGFITRDEAEGWLDVSTPKATQLPKD